MFLKVRQRYRIPVEVQVEFCGQDRQRVQSRGCRAKGRGLRAV